MAKSSPAVLASLGVALCSLACGPRDEPVAVPTPTPSDEVSAHGPSRTLRGLSREFDQLRAEGFRPETCRRLADDFVALAEDSIDDDPTALYNAGAVWRECGEHEHAAALFVRASEAAKQLRPGLGVSPNPEGFAPAMVQLAAYAAKRGDLTEAQRLYAQALKADRRSAAVYANLGRQARLAGRMSEAQLNYRRALAVESSLVAARTELARLYLAAGAQNPALLSAAEEVCQQALDREKLVAADPRDAARTYNTCGVVAAKQDDLARAVPRFDTARELDGELCQAHLNAGTARLSYRDFEQAGAALEVAVACRPDSYEAHLALGTARRGLQQYGPARGAYEKALAIAPDRPAAYFNLGVLLQDHLVATTAEASRQIELLDEAKQLFGQLRAKCRQSPQRCRRAPGEQQQQRDLDALAARRMKSCDETAAALREVVRLAAEAEKADTGGP